jgi:hypothetical protein
MSCLIVLHDVSQKQCANLDSLLITEGRSSLIGAKLKQFVTAFIFHQASSTGISQETFEYFKQLKEKL